MRSDQSQHGDSLVRIRRRRRTVVAAGLTVLFAAACGLIAANIYYAQPLIAPISRRLGLPPRSAGLIVTLTQLGYGAGLLLIAPLADLVENRRLTLAAIALAALGLCGAALSREPAAFLACALLIGLGSVAVQVLVAARRAFRAGCDARPRRRRRRDGDHARHHGWRARSRAFVAADSSWRTVFFAATVGWSPIAGALALGLPRAAADDAHRLWRAFGFDDASGADHTHSAPARALSVPACSPPSACSGRRRRCCWRTRSISANAASRCSRWPASPARSPRRSAGRLADRGHSRVATGARHSRRRRRFPHRRPRPGRLAAGAGAAGRRRRSLLDFGAQANLVARLPRHLRARRRIARPAQRPLHRQLLPRSARSVRRSAPGPMREGGWRLASAFGLAFPVAALVSFAFGDATRGSV